MYIIQMFTNFMNDAIEQAGYALKIGEVPVGAVIIHNQKIIATGHNLTIQNNDPTAHAEIIAIRKAAKIMGNHRLMHCDLYVTLEPCTMCAGAITQARIRRLYFGAYDPKGGAVTSGVQFFNQPTCHHKIEVYDGIQNQECAHIMRNFFSKA